MTDELPQFSEGDVLTVRGHRYEVEQVDRVWNHDDRVIQYRVEALEDDATPINIEPMDGEGAFCVTEFHSVDADDIEVNE